MKECIINAKNDSSKLSESELNLSDSDETTETYE